jgi:hypothetical protein
MESFQITLLIVCPFILIAAILLIKYLQGDFTYEEKIIDEGYIMNGRTEKPTGRYLMVQRTYDNGKIVLIRREV